MRTSDLIFARLAGRCLDGAERDGGRRFHAVVRGSYKALCGAKPGRQSAGWSERLGDRATCSRCIEFMPADDTDANPDYP